MWSPASAMLRMAIVSAAWPRDGQQRADAAFERGDALLDDGLGRVHDAGVDVAELLRARTGSAACSVLLKVYDVVW